MTVTCRRISVCKRLRRPLSPSARFWPLRCPLGQKCAQRTQEPILRILRLPRLRPGSLRLGVLAMRNAAASMDFADMEPDDVASRIAGATHTGTAIRATPYRWPDPRSLPTRQWLLGHWLLRGEVTAIIAPGGTGKSTIGTALALSLAPGQPLLGKPLPRGPQSAWIYNLEDSQDELDRQVSAACLFHGIVPDDCRNRLCVDSGLVQPLCTATEDRDGFAIAEGVFAQVAATVRERALSVVIVDPFVSSHTVRESSNEAIDAIAKRWKRLAQETGCAGVLGHHTKKLG